LVRDFIKHICVEGDVVTCTALALVLGKEMLQEIGISRQEVLAWVEAFYSLLMRFRLYNKVALLLGECAKGEEEEASAFYQVAQRNQRNTSVRVRFGMYDLGGRGGAGGPSEKHVQLDGGGGGWREGGGKRRGGGGLQKGVVEKK